METLGQLWRTRVRGTEHARDVSDAAFTFFAGVALLAVGIVGTWGTGAPTVSRWTFLLPLALICAVMLAKRRYPVPALVIGLVIFGGDLALGGSLGVMLALFDLIYSAALHTRAVWRRRLEVGVAVGVSATAAVSFVTTGSLQESILAALLVFAILGTPLWWGRSVRQQTELAAMAADRAGDLERLAQLRQEELVREERTRMARDLHDALAGQLSTIAIHAEAMLAAPQPDPARDRQGAQTIRTASIASLREMRAMIGLLRTGSDPATSPARLAELDALIEAVRRQGQLVQASLPDPLPRLPAAVDQAAYRIVQESLTNALKHGAGVGTTVRVSPSPDALVIEVVGAPTAAPVAHPPATTAGESGSGVGLLTMRERAEGLGGSFTAGWDGPPDNPVWHVHATIPLEELS